ncbi:hypothetical protein F2Q68_00006353 [Brassica cretica]|uniref:Secreted protein n=1 Tax=Brassica cretica TaxID=69181 RepID=A0A8S9J6N6_BRACR|nr:hypothetical protein F2Q68_00006353 [Brassica cretica]
MSPSTAAIFICPILAVDAAVSTAIHTAAISDSPSLPPSPLPPRPPPRSNPRWNHKTNLPSRSSLSPQCHAANCEEIKIGLCCFVTSYLY